MKIGQLTIMDIASSKHVESWLDFYEFSNAILGAY